MKRKSERTENEPLRVAFYTRVSTTEQANEGESLDVQLANLRNHAVANSWQPAGEYTDEGHSGTTDNRPQLKRLLGDASQGRFDAVAVVKIDRFMRDLSLFCTTVKDLEKCGVAFIATQEGIDTSARSNNVAGRLILNVLASFAEFESARIGERVADVRRAMTKEGRWGAGRPLYGYIWSKDSQSFEIVEDEARVVRLIFERYRELGSDSVTLWLNENGYRMRPRANRTGEAFWNVRGVWNILKNTAYIGHKDAFAYPPIVDIATFGAAQKKLAEARRIQRNPGHWQLQGRVVCGLCGHHLGGRHHAKRRIYECYGKRRHHHVDGSPRCTIHCFEAEELEKSVAERLWTTCRDSDLLREAMKAAVAQLEARQRALGDTNSIEDELTAIKARKERVWDTYHDAGMPKDRMLAKIGELEAAQKKLLARRDSLDPTARTEAEELRRRIRVVNTLLETNQVSPLTLFETMNLGDMVSDHAAADTPGRAVNIERVRRLLSVLDVKVMAFDDRVEIHGLLPTQVLGANGWRILPSSG